MKAFIFCLLIVATGFAVANTKTAQAPEVTVKEQSSVEPLTELQGFIIGEPRYVRATKEWQFKFAPKKNKQLEDVYMMITVPATKKKYYLGDYVTIKASSRIIEEALSEKNRQVAASNSGS